MRDRINIAIARWVYRWKNIRYYKGQLIEGWIGDPPGEWERSGYMWRFVPDYIGRLFKRRV